MREAWLRQRGFHAGLLSPQVADVLGGRLGARTGAPESLASLAREFRISRERVRQLEGRARERIRRANIALEIELREPQILVRLRVRDAHSGRRRPWCVRRALLRDLGLDERETEVLARRLALRVGEPETLRTVARDAGLSGRRVGQIERAAIDALTRRGTAEMIEERDPELLALLRQRAEAGARRRRTHRGSGTVGHARAR